MRGNFRVWDNKENRYDYGDFFMTTDGELLKDVGSYSVEVWYCEHYEPGRYIAEFSTGIKDKNGEEIYGGDVHGIGDCTFEVRHGSCTDDMTLEESYGWHVYDERDGTGCNLGESEIWVNIIGNIHENPELLERR